MMRGAAVAFQRQAWAFRTFATIYAPYYRRADVPLRALVLDDTQRDDEPYDNGDDTVSIVTTDVDPDVDEGSPAARSRTYGVAAQQVFKNQLGHLPTCSHNAELVVQLSPEMRRASTRWGGRT
jgi:hypothetical protein